MRFFDGAAVDGALSYPALVDILRAAFRQGAIAPLRHHHLAQIVVELELRIGVARVELTNPRVHV